MGQHATKEIEQFLGGKLRLVIAITNYMPMKPYYLKMLQGSIRVRYPYRLVTLVGLLLIARLSMDLQALASSPDLPVPYAMVCAESISLKVSNLASYMKGGKKLSSDAESRVVSDLRSNLEELRTIVSDPKSSDLVFRESRFKHREGESRAKMLGMVNNMIALLDGFDAALPNKPTLLDKINLMPPKLGEIAGLLRDVNVDPR